MTSSLPSGSIDTITLGARISVYVYDYLEESLQSIAIHTLFLKT